MTDAFNQEVKVGDKVVYIKKVAGCSSNIDAEILEAISRIEFWKEG